MSPTLYLARIRLALHFWGQECEDVTWHWPTFVVRHRPWDHARDGF